MARYDEDLHENLFFQTLIRKHKSLFTEAGEKKWLVSTQIKHIKTLLFRPEGFAL